MRAALVLAAGASRRFGARDKRRERLLGRPLIDHALERASAAGVRRILVVTDRPSRSPSHVYARDARLGLGASLIAGLAALRPIEREVLIFLADMPFACVLRSSRLSASIDAVRPVYRGLPGHPLLVRTAVARRLARRGNRGIAATIAKDRLREVPGTPGDILDIDTRGALRRLRYRIATQGGALRLQNKDMGCSNSRSGSHRSRR